MYCTNCGNQVPSGSQFCEKCGSPVVPKSAVQVKNTAKKFNKNKLFIVAIATVVIIIVFVLALGLFRGANKENNFSWLNMSGEYRTVNDDHTMDFYFGHDPNTSNFVVAVGGGILFDTVTTDGYILKGKREPVGNGWMYDEITLTYQPESNTIHYYTYSTIFDEFEEYIYQLNIPYSVEYAENHLNELISMRVDDYVSDSSHIGNNEKAFSWLDLSGWYTDINTNISIDFCFAYDSESGTYFALTGSAPLDYVSVDGYTLTGMEYNGEVTLVYNPSTDTIEYTYFNYTSRWGEEATYKRTSAYSREESENLIQKALATQTASKGNMTASYDMSKASGILASLGMTVDEFKASCSPLSADYMGDSDCLSTRELCEYPSQYIGQSFQLFEPIRIAGIDPRGVDVSFKETFDGYTVYIIIPKWSWQEYVLIYDMRDDIYAPTISKDDEIFPYAIFTGVQTISGDDYVCLQMISVEKTS